MLKFFNVFCDLSFLCEVLVYEIVGEYMFVFKVNFVKVYVNDKFFGFYNNIEFIDEFFLDYYYGEYMGILVKCDLNWYV